MTTKQKIALIVQLREIHDKLAGATDSLVAIGVTPESRIIEEPWRLFDFAVKQVSARIGDRGEWISWHWSENKWGEKGFSASAGPRKMTPIRTAADLVALIESDNEP